MPTRPASPPRTKAKLKPAPKTVEDAIAEKAQRDERLKRRAAREEKRLRKVYAAQDAANALLREEQAKRDREWAEARGASPA
ncbi:hypothetical protein GOFOIKOB_2993 [Methylobacterium tardum]|uniref:Uncharacterized protein n=2 Tax=Methylobacterium tardum TaxID=374432 RepID=A0AA37TG21_9HYPH|nr:hypothetical protein GOFOIKOB_2993 [Methylobacterium tardum]GLS70159.1 hypothetical protein GCM10007890_21720 [Methylobacterium tardum]